VIAPRQEHMRQIGAPRKADDLKAWRVVRRRCRLIPRYWPETTLLALQLMGIALAAPLLGKAMGLVKPVNHIDVADITIYMIAVPIVCAVTSFLTMPALVFRWFRRRFRRRVIAGVGHTGAGKTKK
jgi:hypothetical protein